MMLLSHYGNTNQIDVDDDLLHTDEKTHSPVVVLFLDLILLNIKFKC